MKSSPGYDQLKPPLAPEEEQSYIMQYQNGEENAKKRLIEHNMRLVYFIAHKFKKTYSDIEELVSIGTIGLIKGIASYKLDKKTKLSTYAARCIENEILMYFRQLKKSAKTQSFQDIIAFDHEGNETCMGDLIGTSKHEIEDEIVKRSHIEALYFVLNKLEKKEKEIIKLRFGIGCDKLTQVDIAMELNISQSYISRIERKAIQKIKVEMQKIV